MANDRQLSLAFAPRRERGLPVVRRASEKRQEMLARLLAGPLSTFDAERLLHRGQATIHDLTMAGHDIALEAIDGVDHYVYRGYRPRVRVTRAMRDAYYTSRYWHEVSAARRSRDGHRCRQCSAAGDLEVHHWQYVLFGEDIDHDLLTLCVSCHARIHQCIAGSRVHFPRWITQDLAQRFEVLA